MYTRKGLVSLFIATMVAISGCAELPVKMGDSSSKTAATGSAGGTNSQNANAKLEHCDTSLGTMAVLEEQHTWWYTMRGYGLQSMVPVIRLLAQQSNCFVVVERGKGLRNIKQERSLNDSGELRSNSNFNKGQLVAADYTLTPTLTFSAPNTSGVGGALGGLFGSVGAVIGGSLKFSQASSLMTLVDNRSGVQVLAAEGSAKGSSFGGFLGLSGSKLGGALGSYAKTPEAKVIVAAMMDAFNNAIISSRSYVAQETKGGLGTGGGLAISGSNEAAPAKSTGKTEIKEAQIKLYSLGYAPGVADGIMGGKTRTALKQFQSDKNLPLTGLPDQATLSKLRQE